MTQTQRGSPADVSPDLLELGYEPSDVPPRGVVYALAGLFATLLLSGLMLWGMLAVFARMEPEPTASPLEARQIVPPEPRLEAAPLQSRAEIEAAAAARLSGYGWADRQAGLARIPIEDAMRLLAVRGWPDPAREAQP